MSRPGGRWLLLLLLVIGVAGGGVWQIYLPARRAAQAAMPAQKVVEEFMACRLGRDEACARAHLTRSLHAEFTATGQPDLVGGVDPHYQSYRIISKEQQEDGTWLFVVRITEEMAGKGRIGWFEEELHLVPIEDTFLIAQITKGPYHYY